MQWGLLRSLSRSVTRPKSSYKPVRPSISPPPTTRLTLTAFELLERELSQVLASRVARKRAASTLTIPTMWPRPTTLSQSQNAFRLFRLHRALTLKHNPPGLTLLGGADRVITKNGFGEYQSDIYGWWTEINYSAQ